MLLFHLHHNYCGEDGERSRARDIRPSITGQPHMLQTSTSTDRHGIASPPHPHHYFLPEPLCVPSHPHPHPRRPPRVPAVFLDWFHLFNDGCANDPSHAADGVIDTRTCQEWGLDGDPEREGRVLLKGQSEMLGKAAEGWGKLGAPCTQALFVFPKQTRTLDAGWKLKTTPWRNFHTVAQMKRDPSTSHQSPMVVSSAPVDISFLKRLCDSCRERPGNAKYTSGIFLGNWYYLGDQRKKCSYL